MRKRSTLAFTCSIVALLVTISHSSRADEKPIIEKIRALNLPYAAGTVPVYYSAGFEARALRYQKAIIACQQWYDQQLGNHVDFTLVVLDKADWEKTIHAGYPMPFSVGVHSSPTPAVVLPARFEDFPNIGDFADDPELLVENISFHELGHIYAGSIDMRTDDIFLAETYANIFMASFIRAFESSGRIAGNTSTTGVHERIDLSATIDIRAGSIAPLDSGAMDCGDSSPS
jgi:hypothetical protein